MTPPPQLSPCLRPGFLFLPQPCTLLGFSSRREAWGWSWEGKGGKGARRHHEQGRMGEGDKWLVGVGETNTIPPGEGLNTTGIFKGLHLPPEVN